MPDPKVFPAPRPRSASTPYRKAGVPAPPAIDEAKIEIHEASRPPPSRDVFDELATVEIDPRAIAERRSADRFWGVVFTIVGVIGIVMAAGFDWETIFTNGHTPFKTMFSLHSLAVCALVIGIFKLRSRGLDEP